MGRKPNQKLKLLYLKDFLENRSDEEHPVGVKHIIAHLESNGISCERKTVYDDLEELRDYGLDIIKIKTKTTGYYVGARQFELSELRFLIDAVSTSKFLTANKTKVLTEKLSGMSSEYERKWLKSFVYNVDTLKSPNEQILLNIFYLHKATTDGKVITFKYWQYIYRESKEYRRKGEPYRVEPCMLTYNDGNYYLVAYDLDEEKMKTFRVDKVEKIRETDEDITHRPKESELTDFIRGNFSMFDGEQETVTLSFDESFIGVILDRFGRDTRINKGENGILNVKVKIKISKQFFGWLTGIGDKVRITSPVEVRESYLEHLKNVMAGYDI